MRFTINADGGARRNPGPAGAGAVVRDESGAIIAEVSEYLGETTNNVAEYTAVLEGLKALAERLGEARSKETEVDIKMDSELVVKQMRGEYKIKHKNLVPLAQLLKITIMRFKNVTFAHVPREKNTEADALANKAMDRGA